MIVLLQVSLQVPLQHLPPLRSGGVPSGADLHEVLLTNRTHPSSRAKRPRQDSLRRATTQTSPGLFYTVL
jgi:hypothetical protein